VTWKSLGGKSRNYLNTETGEIISRRQYDKRIKGIKYEEKAKKNKAENLKAAVARPARGRQKAKTEYEIEQRLKALEEKAEQERIKKLNLAASRKAKKFRVKKIRPQLLKAGHRAVRIPFKTHDEFADLRKQMLSQKLPNGRRLISSYGLGITGIDERTGKELDAFLISLQSPNVNITETELYEITDEFIGARLYFIFSHYFLHLHFDREYAESKYKKSLRKNLPSNLRKR